MVFGGLLASLLLLRREGHSDVWGRLLKRYPAKRVPDEYPASKEPIYIYLNERWIEWSEAWLIFAPEGLYIDQPLLLEWMAPSVLIPWYAITETETVEVLKGRRLALNIEGIGYGVAIACRHKEVIKNRGQGFCA